MAPDHFSTRFAALASPTRYAIPARLGSGDASVVETSGPFEMSLLAISRDLNVLEEEGLFVRGRHGQWRPCRPAPRQPKDAAEWLEGYQQFWKETLGRLNDYLCADCEEEEKDGRRN